MTIISFIKKKVPVRIKTLIKDMLPVKRVIRKHNDSGLMMRYVAKCLGKDSVYVEVGPATGASAKLFSQFSGLSAKNCYLVEACPLNCEVIKREMPFVHVLNYAVTDRSCVIPFYVVNDPSEPGTSRSNTCDRAVLERKFPGTEISEIKVPGRDLGSIFLECGIDKVDYLFMNIEGAVYRVFEGDLEFLNKIRIFAIDLHHGLYNGASDANDMAERKYRIYDAIRSYGFVNIGGHGREDIATADYHMSFLWEKEARAFGTVAEQV
jgi:FkbM family methyltransferase